MANRYWVGGTETWNATAGTKWSTTSGGASGSAIPTSADDVFLDGASGAVTVTTSTGAICLSLNCTGFTGTFNSTSFGLNIYGSLTFVAGMTLAASPTFNLRATDSRTITTGGKTLGVTIFNGIGGTWTLQDTFVGSGYISLSQGTLNANNFNVTTVGFISTGTSTRTLTMGSGTWTTSASSLAWYITTPGNFTLNSNTSTIKLTSATYADFLGGGKTYNNVWFAGGTATGISTIYDSNTFADLKDDGTAAHTRRFADGTTQTVTSTTIAGTAGNLITLTGTSTAGWTITDTTGTNTVSHCNISYSTATGGAVWVASDGTNTDGGNNTGWRFVDTPSLSTTSVSNTTRNNATAVGNVTSDNASTITERGFVWSLVTAPTTSDNKVIVAGTTGSYNGGLTSLLTDTVYYVRAYATNGVGTAYGNEMVLTSLSNIDNISKPTTSITNVAKPI